MTEHPAPLATPASLTTPAPPAGGPAVDVLHRVFGYDSFRGDQAGMTF